MALLGTYKFYLIAPWIDPPVYVVHYVKSIRNVLVKIWLRMVVCHVVQEVDVGERPAGKLVGIRSNLEIVMSWPENSFVAEPTMMQVYDNRII